MVGCTTKDHAEMMKDLLLLTFPTESALNDDGTKWVIRSWWVTYSSEVDGLNDGEVGGQLALIGFLG